MTGTDVITNRARVILDDTVLATYRWTDAVLLAWLNEGARLIAEKRPESLLTAPYTMATYADISALANTVILPDKYRDALVDFVCSRALDQEAQDERDLARSQDFMGKFISKAGIGAVMGGR
jgi:hypothetical protein